MVAGLALQASPGFGWVGDLALGPLVASGPLAASPAIGQADATTAAPTSPQAVMAAIELQFRSAKLFTDDWYHDHPTAWRPTDAAGDAAAETTWDAIEKWLTIKADPVFYDYGGNIVVTVDGVFFGGHRAASAVDYAQAAAELAATGAKEPAKTDRWMSLGTFALVAPQRASARAFAQLAVSRTGLLRGTYVDAMTRQPATIVGAVDTAYQRLSWSIGKKGTTLFDTGLENLIRRGAPLLVHYEAERTELWLTVRMEAREADKPTTTPSGQE